MTIAIDLPRTALRALHSGFVSYLVGLEPELRDSFLIRVGGLAYWNFTLAIFDGRLVVTTRIDNDDALVGIALPISDSRYDRILFELRTAETGVSVEWLLAAGALRLDESLDELLGGGA